MFLVTEIPFETGKVLECYVASGGNLCQRCGAPIKNNYSEDHGNRTLPQFGSFAHVLHALRFDGQFYIG